MNNRIKKFLKENKKEITESFVLSTVSIVCYTITCKAFGYQMTKPVSVDDKFVYFRGNFGQLLRCPILPDTK